MSESAEKTSTPGNVVHDTGIRLESSDDDHTKRDPSASTLTLQINLLEALQNFVTPLVQAADRKNKKDITQVYLGLEAGKLLTALQEFISSLITQTQIRQPQEIEVDLKDNPNAESPSAEIGTSSASPRVPNLELDSETDLNVDDVLDGVLAESPSAATDNAISKPGLLEDGGVIEFPGADTDSTDPEHGLLEDDSAVRSPGADTDSAYSPSEDSVIMYMLSQADSDPNFKAMYRSFIAALQGPLREHVFRKMPIRLLHFTDTPRDAGTKLQITLLDGNGICSRIIERIQADHTESKFTEGYKRYDARYYNYSTPIIMDGWIREYTGYAILSHTWLHGSDSEVTYDAWQTGQFDTQQPGFQKLANFCKSIWNDHRLSFGWMDTICINKNSSAELDESIRSMHKWYKDSKICITYLAETLSLKKIHRDPWFTRGWTFQELVAPKRMSFYNKDWKIFIPYTWRGDKKDAGILGQIFKATSITEAELDAPNDMPISRKMQLAAKRQVTREEDIAYSLMGICSVSISIAYGEGAERSFFRLMTEILNTSRMVVEIFNCASTAGFSIIPSTPQAYHYCSKVIMETPHYPPIEPLLLTHVGLRMPILLMPSLRAHNPCLKNNPVGDYHAMTELPTSDIMSWDTFHILDEGILTSTSAYGRTFGVLNFSGNTTSIYVPLHCLAICFSAAGQVQWDSTWTRVSKIELHEPIVFQLMARETSASEELDDAYYILERSELETHGMTLTTMYL